MFLSLCSGRLCFFKQYHSPWKNGNILPIDIFKALPGRRPVPIEVAPAAGMSKNKEEREKSRYLVTVD